MEPSHQEKIVITAARAGGSLPAMKKLSVQEILEQAEKLLGRQEIATGLRVSEDVVKSWCEGTGTLSDSHLLRLADLLARYAEANK